MSNFIPVREYKPHYFSDVPSDAWYAENVKRAYEFDLINGTGKETFSPDDNHTVAESIAIACRLHSIYHTGEHEFNSQHEKWYMPYVDYALNNGIIADNQFSDYDAKATRLQFVTIVANALPRHELNPVNNYTASDIPDAMNDESVHLLYNAGVLTGSDNDGRFNPQSFIKRSEVSAIIIRLADKSQRKQTRFESHKTIFEGDTVYNFFYIIQNDVITVVSKYGAHNDIVTTLKRNGGNNLFDFYEFATLVNNSKNPFYNIENANTFITSYSDWHAPFFVKAKNNIDGDDAESLHFTGGNHEYTNTGAGGTPTAATVSLSVSVDGAPVYNRKGYGNKLEISWTNLVQATNTKKVDGSGRAVLKETHAVVFDGKVWDEHIALTALEDVTVHTWYGLQCMGTSDIYKNNLLITEDESAPVVVDGTVGGNCGNNKASKFVGFGDIHKIEMGIDPVFGLGTREMYSGTQGLFSTDYGKAYFRIIQDADLHANTSYELKGYYKFMPAE